MAAKNKAVIISPQAQDDILNLIEYLDQNWNKKVVDDFLKSLESFYLIVSIHPKLFGYYNKRKNIRNFALSKQNIIFYRNTKTAIEIITVFDGRQHNSKLKKIL
jgi:plasmid stabilization system protein ParE